MCNRAGCLYPQIPEGMSYDDAHRQATRPMTEPQDVEDFLGWLFRDGGLEPPRRSYDEVAERLAALVRTPETLDVERGTCWFCKGEFVVHALIAGYDTFEEQRLACLACNERMSGDWRPSSPAPPEPTIIKRPPITDEEYQRRYSPLGPTPPEGLER